MKSMKLIMESFKKYITEQEEGLDDDMMTELLGLLKSGKPSAVIQGIDMAEMFMEPQEIIDIVMKNTALGVKELTQGGKEISILSKLLEMEHDGAATEVPERLFYFGEEKKLSPEGFAILSKHWDSNTRHYVAESSYTPPEVLASLVKDEDEYVRIILCYNFNTPPEVLASLVKDESEKVRSSLAHNNNTPPEILTILAKDESEKVRSTLVHSHTVTPEALYILAKDEILDIRNQALEKMKSMKSIMESFRKYIAEQEERLDDDMMDQLLGLLKNENTEAVIQGIGMAEMFMDPEEIIDIVVKNNVNSADKLIQGGENSIISKLLEMGHDGISAEVFAILSKHLDWEGKRLIVISHDTPPELLAFFVKDEYENVRSNLARNPNTPLEALYILAKDEDEDVRSNLASSRNTPPEVMEILAKDEDEEVRISLARNRNTPPEALKILAKSDTGDGFMVSAVLKNPSTPPEIFDDVIKYMPDDFLTRSDTSTGLNLVVDYPNTAPHVLAILTGHYSKFFRNKVANHPNATVEVLRLLQRDEYLPTRRVARNRLKKMLNK